MIDLHTHTIFSDGELIPSELVRRAVDKGYQAIAMTDHADLSNLDFIVPRMVKVCKQLEEAGTIQVIPGIELTHVPPAHIGELAKEARRLGAQIIVVHGETIVEPVKEGTNLAAVAADIDILAHPGLITEEEVRLAKRNGVMLEITARKGHSLTNGHVAKRALAAGAGMVLNTDGHAPDDLISDEQARRIALGAGLSEEDYAQLEVNAREIIKRAQ